MSKYIRLGYYDCVSAFPSHSRNDWHTILAEMPLRMHLQSPEFQTKIYDTWDLRGPALEATNLTAFGRWTIRASRNIHAYLLLPPTYINTYKLWRPLPSSLVGCLSLLGRRLAVCSPADGRRRCYTAIGAVCPERQLDLQ